MNSLSLISLTASIFILVLLLCALAVAAEAKDKMQTAKLRPGLRGDGGKVVFYTDYLIPIFGSEESLVFLNPKVIISDAHTDEENLGIGYRRILSEDEWILGANLFYDTRYSENGFRYHQVGCGLEALSEWLDLRLNYYHPTTGKKHIKDSYGFGERSLLRYKSYEEPLRGLDGEVGFLVPKLSDYVETRIYGGGYWYHSRLGKDVEGVKARVEVRPTPALTFNVEVRDDNLFGTDTFVGGYITLPFEIGNIFKGKNPFKGWKEALKFGKGPRRLKERVTDMVERDIDITSCVNKKEEKLYDMIYVDNSNDGDLNENGSLSHPHNTLAEAFTNSLYGQGVWVYVKQGDGTETGYTGNYTLADSVTLWGEGHRYLGLGGGGYPLIDGGGAGNTINLGNNNTVMGCEVQNGAPNGINATDVTGSVIIDNKAHDNNNKGISVTVIGAGTFTATISNNVCYSNDRAGAGDAYGIMVIARDDSIYTVTIEGNSCYSHTQGGNNAGIYVGARRGQIYPTIRGNNFSNNARGLIFEAWSGTAAKVSRIDATVQNNTISQNSSDGIIASYFQGYITQNLKISDNVITNNNNGFRISMTDAWPAQIADVDLGGGTQGSRGYNSIYDNTTNEILNNSLGEIKAENNWWGTDDDPPGKFGGTQPTDYDPWLTSDPN